MQRTEPRARTLTAAGGPPLRWDDVRARAAATPVSWLTSLRADGRPHTRPVRALWLGDRCFTASGAATRKTGNLLADARCSLATSAEDVDVTIEGEAVLVDDDLVLSALADAYLHHHDWPVTVDVGVLDGPTGAPTAGPPPYLVVEVVPRQVFAFGTTDALGPRSTRFTF